MRTIKSGTELTTVSYLYMSRKIKLTVLKTFWSQRRCRNVCVCVCVSGADTNH